MAVTYYALLTTVGAGKLANATALGTTLKVTQLAVGDGGGNVPTPDASRTALVNEVRRAPLNQLSVDPANAAQIIAEQVIPEDVGGWWIREMGLYDEAGALIAYANCAPSYKPQLAEGSGRTQTVRMVLIVSNTASVELKIDPSVVLATREYVDSAIVSAMNKLDQKQSTRVATTANITLSGLQTLDGVALAAGDRVLVKNQTNAPDNGIYLAASGAWKRAGDADASAEVTPNLTVAVEEGSTQADSIWQLTTNAPIVLGTTALVFQNITTGLAPLASPVFTGNPTVPTPALFDSDTSVATTEFVQRALGNHSAFYDFTTSVTLSPEYAGSIVQFILSSAATVTLPRDLPKGSVIRVINAFSSQGVLTVNVPGGVGSTNAIGGQKTVSMANGTEMEFVSYSPDTGSYQAIGGSGAGLLGVNGYQKLPSGLIIQWGTFPVGYGAALTPATSGVPTRNSFPIAFPNACLSVSLTHAGGLPLVITAKIISKTQFDAFSNYVGTGASAYMIAVGY
ncbi:phage tail protein [Pseudomonas citronellolis]|uniref:phage tail protein n=1 Tax=Pseudomonas citronellolis TaxID=53408 RepID=UPI00248E782C|nr:phage tail protein [Pseudomonas citronellolis]